MTQALAFKSLRIWRESYGPPVLKADIEVSLYTNNLTVELAEEAANQVLAVVAPHILKGVGDGLQALHTGIEHLPAQITSEVSQSTGSSDETAPVRKEMAPPTWDDDDLDDGIPF